MRKIIISISLGLVTLLTGCASVTNSKSHSTIETIPPDANLKIDKVSKDFDGNKFTAVQTGEAPQYIKFEGCADYRVTAEKDGITKEFIISQSVNPAIFGNLIFGGVVGLVIDGASGNACKSKERYTLNMNDGTVKNNDSLPDDVVKDLNSRHKYSYR